jgi:uncharacterized protein DUF5677
MPSGSTLSAVEKRAFAFAENVRKQAAAIVDAAFAQVVFKDNKDPKLYGLALLSRSISNFQGALTMARRDQAVECLTLVRSCWENLFLVHQLHQDGAGFVKTMRSHEAWGRISLGEWLLENHVVADSPFGKTIRDLIKRERLNAPKKLDVKGTATGGVEQMYAAYAELSHDAAHPSVTALERHFRRGDNGRWTMDIAPPFKPGERLATLDMACNALLGVCLAISALLGGTSQDEALGALWERFVRQGMRTAK